MHSYKKNYKSKLEIQGLRDRMSLGAPTVHKDLSLISLVPRWLGSESTNSLKEFILTLEASAQIGRWETKDTLQISIFPVLWQLSPSSRTQTPFLFNHWSASKCLVFMAARTPIHVFLGRPVFLLFPGIHSITHFGSLSSCILLMWPCHWSKLDIAALKLKASARVFYQGCTELHTRDASWNTFKEVQERVQGRPYGPVPLREDTDGPARQKRKPTRICRTV